GVTDAGHRRRGNRVSREREGGRDRRVAAAEGSRQQQRLQTRAGHAKHGATSVDKRRRERGYQVSAVTPNATQVEGDRAYPALKSIPGGVDAVVIGTRPEYAPETVRECSELGFRYGWVDQR